MQHSAPVVVPSCREKGGVRTIIHGRGEYTLNYLGGGGGGVRPNGPLIFGTGGATNPDGTVVGRPAGSCTNSSVPVDVGVPVGDSPCGVSASDVWSSRPSSDVVGHDFSGLDDVRVGRTLHPLSYRR